MSINQVLASDLINVHGYGYATKEQVELLYSHAGASIFGHDATDIPSSENNAGVFLALDLLGCTINCSTEHPEQYGFLKPSGEFGPARFSRAVFSSEGSVVNVLQGTAARGVTGEQWGSWLVKAATVPIPSTSSLILLGLLALFSVFRSRKCGT